MNVGECKHLVVFANRVRHPVYLPDNPATPTGVDVANLHTFAAEPPVAFTVISVRRNLASTLHRHERPPT